MLASQVCLKAGEECHYSALQSGQDASHVSTATEQPQKVSAPAQTETVPVQEFPASVARSAVSGDVEHAFELDSADASQANNDSPSMHGSEVTTAQEVVPAQQASTSQKASKADTSVTEAVHEQAVHVTETSSALFPARSGSSNITSVISSPMQAQSQSPGALQQLMQLMRES